MLVLPAGWAAGGVGGSRGGGEGLGGPDVSAGFCFRGGALEGCMSPHGFGLQSSKTEQPTAL